MREIHIEPIVFTARLFSEGRSFSNKTDPFDAILTIQKMGSVALLSGLQGRKLDRWTHKELMRQLKALGIERYFCSRGENDICRDVP